MATYWLAEANITSARPAQSTATTILHSKMFSRSLAQLRFATRPPTTPQLVRSFSLQPCKANNVNLYYGNNGHKNANGFLVTCEHAGNMLPADKGVSWGVNDVKRDLASKHWAYDPGAKEFSIQLGQGLECPVITSEFSRLFIDLNRPIASKTLARTHCDGELVELNDSVDLDDRIGKFYIPYHLTLEKVAQETNAKTAISVHTFTPEYEGSVRDFEIGVLYSVNMKDRAVALNQAFLDAGFTSKVNAPWSGKHGFMFSVDCFCYNSSVPGDRKALMLEFRNDVCTNPSWRARCLEVLLPFLLQDK